MKLIDKDALVAEIDKGINGRNDWQLDEYRKGYHDALIMLKKYLSILEVKEMDLKKEFSKWWKDERAKDYNVDILYERYSNVSMKLAKYFFELGLKAQKGK